MIGNARLHCWRDAQSLMNASEVVVHKVQCQGVAVILHFLTVCKGGEGASIDGKPAFLRAKNLEPFISNELLRSTTPIEFIPEKGAGYQGRAFGYRASLLPDICWVYQREP